MKGYYYQKQLIEERGWTKSIIKKLLGNPDKIVPFRKGNVYYYEQNKVLQLEKTEEFELLKQKIQIRIASGKKTAKKRTEKLIKEYELITIEFLELHEKKSLEQLAVESYNFHKEYTEQYDKIIYEKPNKLNKEFLDRITVNFIKHNLVKDYDYWCEELKGKIGKMEVYIKYKKRVLETILQKYPKYKNAIEIQIKQLTQVY